MRLSINDLNKIIDLYKKELINKRIEDISLVNSRLFLFKIRNLDKRLIIDLDNNNPHIGLISTAYDELSLPNSFIKKLLTKGKPLIENIELVNNDKLIKVTTSATDSYYHHNNYYLYIELINAHANMILVNKDNIILGAFYETNIAAPRIILTNYKYTLPNKKEETNTLNKVSLKEYEEYVYNSFNLSIEKRKKELFGPILKKHEKKIKSLEKKINRINLEKESANNFEKYKEYGETILMNSNDIHKGDIEYRGIKLDPVKSSIENANIYFNKYKKCKRTISSTETILEALNKELVNEKYRLEVLSLSSEEEINKLINDSNKKNHKEIEHAYLPYYIKYKDIIFYYGHNALENDYLSFKLFSKNSNVIWLHIKDKPSSHLIINKSNPSNNELDIACSLLLFINKTTTGEIMIADRKDITRSTKLGEANVLKYKSVNMKKINSIVYELIKRERRLHE